MDLPLEEGQSNEKEASTMEDDVEEEKDDVVEEEEKDDVEEEVEKETEKEEEEDDVVEATTTPAKKLAQDQKEKQRLAFNKELFGCEYPENIETSSMKTSAGLTDAEWNINIHTLSNWNQDDEKARALFRRENKSLGYNLADKFKIQRKRRGATYLNVSMEVPGQLQLENNLSSKLMEAVVVPLRVLKS